MQTSDKVSEEQRHLSDGPLDGLRGDGERHQVSGRHIADGHQVAAVVERAQDNPVQEEIGAPLKRKLTFDINCCKAGQAQPKFKIVPSRKLCTRLFFPK